MLLETRVTITIAHIKGLITLLLTTNPKYARGFDSEVQGLQGLPLRCEMIFTNTTGYVGIQEGLGFRVWAFEVLGF